MRLFGGAEGRADCYAQTINELEREIKRLRKLIVTSKQEELHRLILMRESDESLALVLTNGRIEELEMMMMMNGGDVTRNI